MPIPVCQSKYNIKLHVYFLKENFVKANARASSIIFVVKSRNLKGGIGSL